MKITNPNKNYDFKALVEALKKKGVIKDKDIEDARTKLKNKEL
jgi:hypothetical protein